jgi:hypothetical protein
MPAEQAEPEQPDPLSALGRVDPPVPGVLESAREALWAVVAAEMLADNDAPEQAAGHAPELAGGKAPKRAVGREREQAVRRQPEAGS